MAVYPDEPRLYQYAYSVEDDYEGAVISAQEASDEYATHGSYEVRPIWKPTIPPIKINLKCLSVLSVPFFE